MTKVEILQHRINTRVRLGDDLDEALEDAIKQAFPMRSEDAQADLFAKLRPLLDEYPNGARRKIALTQALKGYEMGRARG